MDEMDVWRSATLLISQYGDEAGLVAVTRAGELLKGGDSDGCDTWLLIVIAIGYLERQPSVIEPGN